MKNKLRIVLQDNENTMFGGVMYQGETLKDFLDSIGLPYNTKKKVINRYLIANGIMPIK